MAKIYLNLPPRLKKRLEKDKTWDANVTRFIENMEPYFHEKPEFFPEYTNHGLIHMDNVLEFCDKLIPDKALRNLSPREVAVLIMAALSHDIGMFVKRPGLSKLLFGEWRKERHGKLDALTLVEEWDDYLARVMRYPAKKLIQLFGNAERVTPPPTAMDDLVRKDEMIYGDFLRQQHPRLAHLFLVKGFPGTTDVDLFAGTVEIGEELRDLVGLMARSHGMALRDLYEHLETHGSLDRPLNIAAVYLMAVLRIADYIDVGEDRAPHSLYEQEHPASPLSATEHKWNQGIAKSGFDWKSVPEWLSVNATPKNTIDFLRIESWLRDVQKEIDTSWACLGEVFQGRDEKLLSIRRIDSNILKKKSRAHFQDKFLVTPATLGVNRDILKLLITPLYGKNPSFGVRELIQNAVDACNERVRFEEARGQSYSPEIVVELDSTNMTLTITDNGMGMNARILSEYYLVAGSSYRNSDDWNRMFCKDGKPSFARSGKFGIGVLATFLLGDSLEVVTRHVNDKNGYSFSLEMEHDFIGMKRVETAKGTRITIRLNATFFEDLEIQDEGIIGRDTPTWNGWYFLDSPSICYYQDGTELTRPGMPVRNAWYELETDKYKDYRWSFQSRRLHSESAWCNGILIHDYLPRIYDKSLNKGFQYLSPSLSIIDETGAIPVGLARKNLAYIPEREKLSIEICRYILAKHLMVSTKHFKKANSYFYLFDYSINNFVDYNSIPRGNFNKLVFFGNCFGMDSITYYRLQKIDRMLRVRTLHSDHQRPHSLHLLINSPVCYDFSNSTRDMVYFDDRDLFIVGGRTQRGYFRGASSLERNFLENHKKERLGEFFLYSSEDNDDSVLRKLPEEASNYPVILEYRPRLDEYRESEKEDVMLGVLEEYLEGDKWIPIDMKERRKKFPKAFKDLRKYMK